ILHYESRSREVFWNAGTGEWKMVQKARLRFEGHYQPRIPLWGYEMVDNPEVIEKKIDAAACFFHFFVWEPG
ncbi:MAG: glycoside hydrolase family 99-like domain-containing protein, partial [Bacteroidota bacterium]